MERIEMLVSSKSFIRMAHKTRLKNILLPQRPTITGTIDLVFRLFIKAKAIERDLVVRATERSAEGR